MFSILKLFSLFSKNAIAKGALIMASNRKAIERVFIVCRYKTVPSPSYIANSIYYDLGFGG